MRVGDAAQPITCRLDPFGIEAALIDEMIAHGFGDAAFTGNECIAVAFGQVELLDLAEQQIVVAGFRTVAMYPDDLCVGRLF